MTAGRRRAMGLFLAVLLLLSGAASAGPEDLFDYTVLDDGSAMITGYRGYGPELVLPETIDGYTVSALSGSFGTRTTSIRNITRITVPYTLEVFEPGSYAEQYCREHNRKYEYISR